MVLRADGGSAIEILQRHPVTPEVAAAVRGLFDRLGFRVVETGEEVTCVHRGDHIDFEPGLDESVIDFVVALHLFELERLASFFEDGVLDEMEMFRITGVRRSARHARARSPSRHVAGGRGPAHPLRRNEGRELRHLAASRGQIRQMA